jgi:small ubiquitin-related modifier
MAESAQQQAQQDYINLKVKSQEGEEVFFKIKKTTQFKKLMDAYCQRQSVNPSNVRFLYEGERIVGDQNPSNVNIHILIIISTKWTMEMKST